MKTTFLGIFFALSCCISFQTSLAQTVFPLTDAPFKTQWKTNVDSKSTVTIEKGQVVIHSPANDFANIQIPLSENNIRITADIVSDGLSISWNTGICLYWDIDHWCQIIPYGSDILTAVVMNEGKHIETRLCFSPEWQPEGDNSLFEKLPNYQRRKWQPVGLELRDNEIRFLGTDKYEKGVWFNYFQWERKGVFANPPELLIVGKGFSQSSKYKNSEMNNSYSSSAQYGDSLVRNLAILKNVDSDPNVIEIKEPTTTSYEALSQVVSQRDPRFDIDELGILERKAGDPSFESVARHHPAMKHARETLGVKDHANSFNLMPDGSLFCPDKRIFFEVDGHFLLEKPTKTLVPGNFPVVLAKWTKDELEITQEAFAWSEKMSSVTPTSAEICVEIKNIGNDSQTVSFSFDEISNIDSMTNYLADLDASIIDNAQKCLERSLTLLPGQSEKMSISFPYDNKTAADEITSENYEARKSEVVNFWTNLLSQGIQIVTPEQRVNDAYKMWLIYNFMNVDNVDGLYRINDGSNFYEQVYGYSAALMIDELDLMGFTEDAQIYLESFIPMLNQEGLFLVNYGLPDHGTMMLAIVNHYYMTGDEAWLRKMAPTLKKMAQWVVNKRKEVKAKQNPDDNWYGMIKLKPYCDYPGETYFYVSDAAVCTGLEKTAEVFRQIDLDSDAEWIEAEAQDYRHCIFQSMERSSFVQEGYEIIPLFPETHTLLKASKYGACDYYGLVMGCLLEIEDFFPTDSQWPIKICKFLEDKGGLYLGVARFADGIDHAYSYGYWMQCMKRDEIDKVLLGFYTSLAYGMTRDTWSAVECTGLKTGENAHTLSHTYSNTQQLRLLRMMLLREDGNSLLIGQAIPRKWLENGKKLSVSQAPTRFGMVAFDIESQVEENKIVVTLNPPTKSQPEKIRIRLRHPEKKTIANVELQGKGQVSFDKDWIELQNADGKIILNVTF